MAKNQEAWPFIILGIVVLCINAGLWCMFINLVSESHRPLDLFSIGYVITAGAIQVVFTMYGAYLFFFGLVNLYKNTVYAQRKQ